MAAGVEEAAGGRGQQGRETASGGVSSAGAHFFFYSPRGADPSLPTPGLCCNGGVPSRGAGEEPKQRAGGPCVRSFFFFFCGARKERTMKGMVTIFFFVSCFKRVGPRVGNSLGSPGAVHPLTHKHTPRQPCGAPHLPPATPPSPRPAAFSFNFVRRSLCSAGAARSVRSPPSARLGRRQGLLRLPGNRLPARWPPPRLLPPLLLHPHPLARRFYSMRLRPRPRLTLRRRRLPRGPRPRPDLARLTRASVPSLRA